MVIRYISTGFHALSFAYSFTAISTTTTAAQSDKQQPSTIDENCATGSNNAQQTGNGDVPQHAPPLQVSLAHLSLANALT